MRIRGTWIAMGGAIALLLAEVVARCIGFGHPLVYMKSPAGYELAPGQTSTRIGKITHINAQGTRGTEVAPVPAPGTIRILSLGDSVANGGTQINDNQTYPFKLEAKLRRTGMSVEVLNASAAGWATENERLWLQEHGTLGASIIVLEINQSDLDQLYVDDSILNVNPSFPARYPISGIAELLSRYIFPSLGLTPPAADPGATPGGVNIQAEAAMLSNVTDIVRIAKKNNADVIVMYWDMHADAPSAQTLSAREKLFAYLRSESIPLVRPNLSERSDWKTYFRDPWHPNILANEAIADGLSSTIKSEIYRSRSSADGFKQ